MKLRNTLFAIFSWACYVVRRVRSYSWKLLVFLLIADPVAAQQPLPIAATVAQPAPSPELIAARLCYAEAEFSIPDCVAIIYAVLRQAAGRDFVSQALAYGALKNSSARIADANALQDDDNSRWNRATNRLWKQLRQTARAALARKLKDPCPGAHHWGSRVLKRDLQNAIDAIAAGRWRAVVCTEDTANAFYALVKKKKNVRGQ